MTDDELRQILKATFDQLDNYVQQRDEAIAYAKALEDVPIAPDYDGPIPTRPEWMINGHTKDGKDRG